VRRLAGPALALAALLLLGAPGALAADTGAGSTLSEGTAPGIAPAGTHAAPARDAAAGETTGERAGERAGETTGKRAGGEARPLKVLLLGDSFVVSHFGPTLERLLAVQAGAQVVRRAKTSSGLARPDFFDWWAESRRLLAQHAPDVVVLMMGGNDGQELGGGTAAPGTGTRWQSPAWPTAYQERMRSLLAQLEAPGRRVVWLELPPMEVRHLERKVERIRQLQREVVAALPHAAYLPTRALLRTPAGLPLREVPDARGRPAPVRDADGIHFTAAGGRYFAHQVAPLLLGQLRGAHGGLAGTPGLTPCPAGGPSAATASSSAASSASVSGTGAP
jgi:hypothetical protein